MVKFLIYIHLSVAFFVHNTLELKERKHLFNVRKIFFLNKIFERNDYVFIIIQGSRELETFAVNRHI